MMEKINVKLIVIIVLVIAIIGIAIFAVVNVVGIKNKDYVLETISENDYKYFLVYTNEKYGVIDEKGNSIVESKYDNIIIPNPTKPVFIVYDENGKNVVLNEKSEQIFTEFNNVQAIEIDGAVTNLPYEKSVLKYEENGKYGLIDFSGNTITKAIYDEISSVKYKEGEILVKKDDKYGVINNKGIELIEIKYDQIEADKYYSKGTYQKSGYIVRITTEDGYNYGYIDSNWKELLDTKYTSISRILDIESDDTYLIVSNNGRYGVIKNKNEEIGFEYQSIKYNKDINSYLVEKNGQYGVININGDKIIDVKYKNIKVNGIYIFAETYTESKYFNQKGEEIENGYTTITDVPDTKYYITIDNENMYGIIDENGNVVINNDYLYIEYAFDKYFIAYKEGYGLGVIDTKGNTTIEFQYDVLSKIGEYNILKGVDMENDITDIFSNNMEKTLSLEGANIEIHDNYVELYNEKETKFITTTGELRKATEILNNNKLFASCKDNKWGYVDADGNEKVPYEYDYATEFNKYGFAGINKDDKWGVIDENRKYSL